MGTNWKDQQTRRRLTESLPKHFCEECTSLCDEADETCLACNAAKPADGWTSLEQAYDPFLGRVLNERYLISKIEGRGSSSTIYRGDSLSVPKSFAIKMVKMWHSEQGVTAKVRTRLEREVRAVGMLRNPHIVRVYELLELNENWVALVMDHIEGHTVDERVAQHGPMELGRAIALLRQVANGLCEAHDAGMIHRDIKPANIMLEQLPDGDDFAYLLDFGVVRLEGEAKLTQGFLGTPLFASPEQATADDVDLRSDIYSLGATLFFMLTGRAPFENDRSLEVLKAHVQKQPPTLAQACPERSYPAAIERLVARMLAKSPAERPTNLYEVIGALERAAERHTLELDSIPPSPGAPAPAESADLANGLGLEDSCDAGRRTDSGQGPAQGSRTVAFQDRPKTVLGVRHAVELRADADKKRGDEWRAGRESGQMRSLRETNPRGFDRPMTNPKGVAAPRKIEVKQTVQFLPNPAHMPSGDADAPVGAAPSSAVMNERQVPSSKAPPTEARPAKKSNVGVPFARTVRLSGACSEDLIAFVDSHNEIWTFGDDNLVPVNVPAGRVTSITACQTGAYVGLAGGTINRVLAGDDSLELLFAAETDEAITAMAATRSGSSLLAGTAEGALYLGRLQRPNNRWMSLHANRGIRAVAMTPRGGMFAAASLEGFIRVATTEAPGSAIAKLAVDEQIIDMAFSNDGHLLAVLLDDGSLPVFQVLYGRQISELRPDCPRPQSVYFSRGNILYGVCAGDGRIGRWNLTTGRAAADE